MFAPHTVTVFNVWEDDNLVRHSNITVLNGVFIDIAKGANVNKSGLSDADTCALFIPFAVEALSASGAPKAYCDPKQFEAAADKSGLWTLNSGGSDRSTATFFIKGAVTEEMTLAQAKDAYDYVFDVTTVDIRDFGSADMQHWQVGGR